MQAIVAYLHHVLVHFPIALGLLAAVMAVTGRHRANDRFDRQWRIIVQAVAALTVLAVTAGLLAAPHAEEAGLSVDKLFWHRLFGIAAGVSFVSAAAVVTIERFRVAPRAVTLARVLTVVGAVAAGLAGHIGGDMLHPGMAPWSKEPHVHTPAIPSHPESQGHQHAHGDHGH